MLRQKSHLFRHLAGLGTGIALFLILIPTLIYLISRLPLVPFSTPIIPNDLWRYGTALIMAIPGLAFILSSNFFLIRQGKGGPLDLPGSAISPRTLNLVIQGPYRYTRNPMAFGANLFYVSMAIFLDSLGALLLVLLFFLTVVQWVVHWEEKRLLREFGHAYEVYCQQTRRFFPFPK